MRPAPQPPFRLLAPFLRSRASLDVRVAFACTSLCTCAFHAITRRFSASISDDSHCPTVWGLPAFSPARGPCVWPSARLSHFGRPGACLRQVGLLAVVLRGGAHASHPPGQPLSTRDVDLAAGRLVKGAGYRGLGGRGQLREIGYFGSLSEPNPAGDVFDDRGCLVGSNVRLPRDCDNVRQGIAKHGLEAFHIHMAVASEHAG
mmetsp:Transcript_9740/g.16705  ORF Transcript_9740/g.16705 Transcript_9740/m.16705 type:complete len:203 (+) Transcript_9740:172-780(+)